MTLPRRARGWVPPQVVCWSEGITVDPLSLLRCASAEPRSRRRR
jgi:hypothetical protein